MAREGFEPSTSYCDAGALSKLSYRAAPQSTGWSATQANFGLVFRRISGKAPERYSGCLSESRKLRASRASREALSRTASKKSSPRFSESRRSYFQKMTYRKGIAERDPGGITYFSLRRRWSSELRTSVETNFGARQNPVLAGSLSSANRKSADFVCCSNVGTAI